AENLPAAIRSVYGAVGKITFDGAYYRRDIAAKALPGYRDQDNLSDPVS
ncbi:hypothetical protein JW992_04215, partial [candidate division KSB1 bacterium]|nr:hypothetical protein [candidate division KSB1 bacterium]